jgi:hypothetical protein
MASWLRQSTAVDIAFGPFVDKTDGATAEIALTITQAEVRLKKNAAAWAQKNQSSNATHEENGWYEVNLDTTDTNTLGLLVVAVNESADALPVWKEYMVVPANVYDSIISGTEWLDVCAMKPVWSITGGVLTVLEQNDSTTQFTKNVGTTPGAEPVTSIS